MSNPIPTEAEIRNAAARLGYVDVDGDYPPAKRAQLAKFVLEERDELEKAAERLAQEQPNGTTAVQIARFVAELDEALGQDGPPISSDTVERITVAVAHALVRRSGLHLNIEGTAQ